MRELPKAYNPHEVEDAIYKKWEDAGLFHAAPNSQKKPYSIVIPPPNITGILHMGHALNDTIQDILIRFKRMQGYETEWMPGTDHAGIATQNVVEKRLMKSGVRRDALGREKFVEEVWKWREEYGTTIIRQLKKLGSSCDWNRTRFTMDDGLSDAVLEVFVRLYEKGLIYKGNYIINWCPRCRTALSDEESQHKDVDGMLYHIKYPIKGASGKYDHVVIATTRPETMLGDVAVAINPSDERFKHIRGKTLVLPIINRDLRVIEDEIVDLEFGTGALKVTPAHDPVDFELGRKHSLEQINVMNDDATINSLGGDYSGLDRFEAREAIIEDLKEAGLFIKAVPHRHAVGHCYRCHTMVEPRLSPQWFVRMKALAKPAIEAVESGKIKFYPERWTKVYLDWMYNIRDWCISRQIWWGHRIPVYYCTACSASSDDKASSKGIIVSRTKPEKCPDCGGSDIKQDQDVLDTWFSSWLWPFSTFGWPKKSEELKYFYPTDTLVTAQEIIFFWVARMIMAGIEFAGDIPFKDVYIHGTVRDATGAKMSKSLGNIIDPLEVIKKYGTDALRFSIISITSQGQDVFLSENKFELGRNFANKLWNASRFILMNLKDGNYLTPKELKKQSDLTFADRWILSRFNSTVRSVTGSIDQYKFNEAANALYEFFWHEFCDWYIEMSKMSIDQKTVQSILYNVLEASLKALHPFMPFVTEELWLNLKGKDLSGTDTIMTSAWPHSDPDMIDNAIENKMSIFIDVVTAIRNIRSAWNIEQQKLVKAMVRVNDPKSAGVLKEGAEMIKKFGKLEDVSIGDFPKPKNSAASVLKDMEVYISLEGLIDFEKEKKRLEKEKLKLSQESASITGRLNNAEFVSKAPADVIDRQKARKEDIAQQIKKIEENIIDITV